MYAPCVTMWLSNTTKFVNTPSTRFGYHSQSDTMPLSARFLEARIEMYNVVV